MNSNSHAPKCKANLSLWPIVELESSRYLGRNMLRVQFLAVSDIYRSYPMLIQPTITWVPLRSLCALWLDTKNTLNNFGWDQNLVRTQAPLLRKISGSARKKIDFRFNHTPCRLHGFKYSSMNFQKCSREELIALSGCPFGRR